MLQRGKTRPYGVGLNMNSEKISELTHKALLKVRQKLLDLSKRNRLLNFKETVRSIRIIDELPNQVFSTLVTEIKSMAIIPTEEHDDEPPPGKITYDEFVKRAIASLRQENENGIHAEKSGFVDAFKKYYDGEDTLKIISKLAKEGKIITKKVSDGLMLYLSDKPKELLSEKYELPSDYCNIPDKYGDLCLQTPYTVTILERRCTRLHQNVKTAIEETGSNFLYLSIGYLEWYEDDDSDISYKAPLILIPVQLERWKIDRKNNCYNYKLSYTQDDIGTNLSLALKLSIDFDLTLPELDDQINPEEYLQQISELISHKKRWRVVCEMVVGMFSFAKILMYKDLDPEKWPNKFKITEHEKIREILRTQENTALNTDCIIYDGEYDIDGNIKAEKIPLILDADSSQHSVIMDVLDGKDLVVEGPPGTGKSQTITNLIAAALYEGKSVLFVAEKKAALEVVRRRLNQAGLGDFCLELHSTKMHKGILHEDIRKRLERRFKEPEWLKYTIDDLLVERDKLRTYIELINKVVGPSGETIYQIMWKAERWRSEMPSDQNIFFSFDNALRLTRNDIQEKNNILAELVHILKELPLSAKKTFNGFSPTNLLPGDEQSFKTLLSDLIETSGYLSDLLSSVEIDHCLPLTKTFGEIEKIANIDKELIVNIPDYFEQSIATQMSNPNAIKIAYKLKEDISEYNNLIASADSILKNYQSLSVEQALRLKETVLSIAGKYGNYTVNILESIVNESEKAVKLLYELKIIANIAKDVLIEDIKGIKHFQTLISIINLIINAPNDIDINHHSVHISPFAAQILQKAKKEATDIKDKINSLSLFFHLSRLPRHQELKKLSSNLRVYSGKFFPFMYPTFHRIRRVVSKFVTDNRNVKHSQIVSKLYEIAKLLELSENTLNNSEYTHVLGPQYNGIDTDWERLENHISWIQSLKNTVGTQAFAEKIIGNINHCRDLSLKLEQKVKNTIEQIETILQKLQIDTENSISIEDAINKNQKITDEIRAILNSIAPYLRNKDVAIAELATAFNNYICAKQVHERLENDCYCKELFGINFNGANTDTKRLCTLADWVTLLLREGNVPQNIIQWFLEKDTTIKASIWADCIDKAKDYLALHFNTLEKIEQIGNLNETVYFGRPIATCEIYELAEKYNECLNQLDYLFLWADYCVVKEKAITQGLAPIIEAIENGKISQENSIANFNYSIYSNMARELIRNYPILSSFTSASYENVRSRFIDLDKKVMTLVKEKITSKIAERPVPRGIGSGPVGGFTDLSLIRQELNKRKRHIHTRQLIRRAGAALKALKPCFMMSPSSVAQYLIPGQVIFDMVVMDEASQIKPEDALGAIARGSKIIVVGDSNQLPPTTFFDRINESVDDDDKEAIEDTESILDICRTTYKSRRLRWHYRSEHESLIAFSNCRFYDDNLIVFPAPLRSSEQLGIRCHYIKDAVYSKGRNLTEAQSIVNAIINHFENCPELSLGVATFNREQKDLIEDLLDKKRKESSWLDNILKNTEEQDEPFFIKNLENVQGDERDVIFISFTYGPDKDTRRVYQRFGPIGSEVGWRRLNVIFTRAKKRVEVFTSMLPTDLVITDNTQKGVRVLREYLDYALNNKFHDFGEISKKDPDSDFEIAVARILNSYGYKTAFQIGVAGFFIDIGVLHPLRQNDFILGIECDGATYHSGKSVRDRDRLRQEILERKGWHIYRIWSTDWFKSREKEIERLIKTLKQIEAKDKISVVKAEPEKPLHIHPQEIITSISRSDDDLQKELLHFRKVNIEPSFRDQSNGILREEMIEAFVKFKPTSKEEFHSSVPRILRENTDSEQGQFLNDIFQIIEEYL